MRSQKRKTHRANKKKRIHLQQFRTADYALIKTQVWSKDPFLTTAGPYIPMWMLQPKRLSALGEKGCLSKLQEVETAYLSNHLSAKMYDEWMSLNAEGYQLGVSEACMKLWFNRLEFCENATYDSMINSLNEGVKAIAREGATDLTTAEEILNFESPYVWLYKCRKHNVYHVKLKNRTIVKRNGLRILNSLFPWFEYGDKQKTNLDMVSFVKCALKEGFVEQLNEALAVIPVGVSNTFATAVLIAAVGNKQWPRMQELLQHDHICCLTRTSHQKYFKAVSIAVRRTSHWYDGSVLDVNEVAALAYFELCTGRAGNLTDWEEEKAKRIGPTIPISNPWTGEDYGNDLRVALEDILEPMMPPRDVWGTWDDFAAERQSWASAGSAGGESWVVDGKRMHVNKHTYFEITSKEEMSAWPDTEPRIEAMGSEKMESGKSRAIYGTKVIDQTICTYVIKPLEKTMSKNPAIVAGHKGLNEIADIDRKLREVRGERVECTMLDYSDFNYQHTLNNQWILYDVLAHKLARYGNADLSKCARWWATAQLNQYVKFPHSQELHKVTQGMFSGVRSTGFTNTLLNLAYFLVAKKQLEQHLGLRPRKLVHYHQGDDVWITNQSRLWAMHLYMSMEAAGFEFTPSKQLFDRGRGEFLRVIYTDEGACGYMMRSVASLLIKPMQNVEDLAPQARATAYNSQINLCYRRGLSAVCGRALWWAMVPHALRLKLPGGGGIGIPIDIAQKSFRLGGLDLGPPMTFAVGGTATAPVPAPILPTDRLASQIPSKMAHDWVIKASNEVKEDFDSKALEAKLHASNVSDSLQDVDRRVMIHRMEKDLAVWNRRISQRNSPSAMGQLGSSQTRRVSYDDLDQPEEMPMLVRYMQETIKELDTLVGGTVIGDRTPSYVDTLMSAIAMSPFKDVSSAAIALKLNYLAAAKKCLQLAPTNPTTQAATLLLFQLEQRLGAPVTTRILKGIRGVGVSYEAILHPIILSWLCKKATNWAILRALHIRITDINDWDAELESWMVMTVRYAVRHTKLTDWSHY